MSLRSTIGAGLRRVGLEPVLDGYLRFEARRPERVRERAWSRDLRRALRASRREVLAGSPAPDAVAVIVCLWNRPHRIDALLDMLSRQSVDRPVRLVLWNNRRENSPHYRERVAARGVEGSLASVEFVDSPANLGGIARFVVARHLRDEGYRGPFVTLDDDQNIVDGFLADLLAAAAPGRLAGVWAWVYDEDYWDRRRAQPGEDARYVGTGGAVFPIDVVADRAFFTDLPPRFGFLEDIWASDRIRRAGGELRAVDTPLEFVETETDQYHALIGAKAEFARWLAAR